ncbi:SH2 domain-containing protein 4A [Cynoglossus semilaevis]|uniref:Zgc:100829 n=1 Tax=Cynoglossus semilaevis TaxID=244447 RepID=A0A3P8VMT2_CYNSE|nr:SH2 domain-containing protein 4A-like [Cynoglossus semilaevis]
MLQQILKDMYIDPDVLDALNDDQKKTLFLKMRQEQVRRWKEREEKLEREGGDAEFKRAKPKKANDKSVSWLLGRDGDVAVIVIGEVDELTSKFISSGFGEKKTQNLQSNTCLQTILKSTETVRCERENLTLKSQPGISLNLKGKREETSTLHPLPVSVTEHSSTSAAEKPEETSASSRALTRACPVTVRPACAPAAPGSVGSRVTFTQLKVTASACSSSSAAVRPDAGKTTAPKTSGSKEPQKSQESQDRNDAAASDSSPVTPPQEPGSAGGAPTCAGRGRVAQLMKNFTPCRLKTKRTSAMPAAGWRDLGGVDPAWSSRNAGMC